MKEVSDSRLLDVILACVLVLPAVLVFQQSATSLTEQGVASGDAMTNAALFPKIVATLLAFLAILQLLVALRKPKTDEKISWNREIRCSVIAIAMLAIYIAILSPLGYHIATPLLCAVLLILLDVRVWIAAPLGLVMSLIVAAFFEGALDVILPVGVFGLTLPL